MSEGSPVEKRQLPGFRNLRESQSPRGALESAPELKRLGRYQIVAELGRGAMGMVYEAHDPRIKRVVAIKIVTVSGGAPGETEAYRTRFIREAQAAGRLTHPGIVTVYDVDEDPVSHTPFIVMEYVPGKRLDTYAADLPSKRLPLDMAVDLAQQIAEALDSAHSQGIVHRDIKPGNVIVTKEGFAKIADFGIAKMNLTEMTLPGQILGTPAFMSPEQFLEGTADGRSDLFSLGVVLYWMLTGVKPFSGESATSISFKLVYRDPTPLRDVAPELDPRFESMLRRALAKDPNERYQTGKEFAQALKALRQGTSLQPAKSATRVAEIQLTLRRFGQAIWPLTKSIVQWGDVLLARLRTLQADEHLKRLTRQWRGGLAACIAVLALLALHHMFGGRPASAIAPAPRLTPLPQPAAALSNSVFPAPPKAVPKHNAAGRRQANRAAHSQRALAPLEPAESANITPPKLVSSNTPEAPKVVELLPPAEPAPRVETVVQPAVPATLLTVGEHQFRSATLTISVDGQLSYTGLLKGTRKIPFGGMKGSLSQSIKLAPGSHLIEVHIASQRDDFDETKSIKGEFQSDKARTLSIGFAAHNADMQLAWK